MCWEAGQLEHKIKTQQALEIAINRTRWTGIPTYPSASVIDQDCFGS
jgi:hypothetical protein